ncbi:MAG: hypothetical protein EWM72_03070 [Nitrospira sp.]|nr:MAG: hypothetical protein EWM72_03070 [Nitrospira sp.]
MHEVPCTIGDCTALEVKDCYASYFKVELNGPILHGHVIAIPCAVRKLLTNDIPQRCIVGRGLHEEGNVHRPTSQGHPTTTSRDQIVRNQDVAIAIKGQTEVAFRKITCYTTCETRAGIGASVIVRGEIFGDRAFEFRQRPDRLDVLFVHHDAADALAEHRLHRDTRRRHGHQRAIAICTMSRVSMGIVRRSRPIACNSLSTSPFRSLDSPRVITRSWPCSMTGVPAPKSRY